MTVSETDKSLSFHFNFNWKLTLFAMLLLPLLLKLGFWQLDRADEKIHIQQSWKQQQVLPALKIQSLSELTTNTQYRRILFEAEIIADTYWLQENQVRSGKLGYQVIMLAKLKSGELLAVDRGWVEGSPLRDFFPEVNTPKGLVMLSGTLVVPTDSKLVREAEVSVKRWPHKILEVDLKVMSAQVKQAIFAQLLKLDADNQAAYDVTWKPINMSPAKHIGYAVQWFALSLALSVLYVIASTNIVELNKRNKKEYGPK